MIGLVSVVATLACLGLLVLAVRWLSRHVIVQIRLDHGLRVSLGDTLPVRAELDQPLEVTIADELHATARLGKLAVHLKETLEVPIDFALRVPIDTVMRIDQTLDFALQVPIDTVLTERELDLSQLRIPIDTVVQLDDFIDLDIEVPIDTDVTTAFGVRVPVKARIPVKMRIPLQQQVRVKDTITLGVHKLNVPLKLDVPVQIHLPLDQDMRVRGDIEARVVQNLSIPLDKTMHADMGSETPLTVVLSGDVKAHLKASLNAVIALDEPIAARVEPLALSAKNLTVRLA